MPYQLPSPSTLDNIFSMNPGAFDQAQQFMTGGVQQADADLQQQQLKNMFEQQTMPSRAQRQVLENQTLEAQLPGVRAGSDMLTRKNQMEGELYPEHVKAARAEFLKKASDADIAELENRAQKMAYDADPNVRKQGEQLLLMSKDMIKERSKQADMQTRQEALETIRQKNALERLQKEIDAGKFKKKGGVGTQDALDKALTSGKWDVASTAYDAMAQRAILEGDDEAAEYYAAKSKEYADKFLASRNSPDAGRPDLSRVPGAEIPVNPTPTTTLPQMPQTARGQTARDLASGNVQFSSPEVEQRVRDFAGKAKPHFSPQAEDWIARAMKANPSLTREQIVEQGQKLRKF